MKSIKQIITILLIGIISIFSILLIQNLVGNTGFDLTQNKLYTLSKGTRNIISSIDKPITFNLYYARKATLKGNNQLQFWNNYFLYVKNLLTEYVKLSNGKIKLNIIDPRPFSDAEEQALLYGIQKIPMSQDENFFFGLVMTNELGRDKVIKIFEPQRQELVEYDISKTIVNLLQRDKSTIGIISSIPIMGDELSPYMRQMMQLQGQKTREPWGIITHLKQTYKLINIDTKIDKIPDNLDFLLIIHPKQINKNLLFSIDQYVMSGGKLIILEDPHCLNDIPKPNPQNPYAILQYDASSNLNQLTKKWGVDLIDKQIVLDRNIALSTPLAQGQAPQLFLPFLGLNHQCVNKDEIITANLNDLTFLFAGKLNIKSQKNLNIRPLLLTTKIGNTWQPKSAFALQNINPNSISNAYQEGDKAIVLSALITGQFKTNFPNGVKTKRKDSKKNNIIKTSKTGAAVVIVADVDFISDSLAYQKSIFGLAIQGQNSSLLLNTLEYLSGNNDLISMRSRGQFQRPFTLIDNIEKQSDKKTKQAIKDITSRIKTYQMELQNLEQQTDSTNVNLIQNKVLNQRQKIELEIRNANKELRILQNQKRIEVERIKNMLKNINLFGSALMVLVIALIVSVIQKKHKNSNFIGAIK